jgi:hypothetical protein
VRCTRVDVGVVPHMLSAPTPANRRDERASILPGPKGGVGIEREALAAGCRARVPDALRKPAIFGTFACHPKQGAGECRGEPERILDAELAHLGRERRQATANDQLKRPRDALKCFVGRLLLVVV